MSLAVTHSIRQLNNANCNRRRRALKSHITPLRATHDAIGVFAAADGELGRALLGLLAKIVHASLESRLPCNHMIRAKLVHARDLHVHVGALRLVHERRARRRQLDLFS